MCVHAIIVDRKFDRARFAAFRCCMANGMSGALGMRSTAQAWIAPAQGSLHILINPHQAARTAPEGSQVALRIR